MDIERVKLHLAHNLISNWDICLQDNMLAATANFVPKLDTKVKNLR